MDRSQSYSSMQGFPPRALGAAHFIKWTWWFCLHVCLYTIRAPGAHGIQESSSYHLYLKLSIVVRCHAMRVLEIKAGPLESQPLILNKSPFPKPHLFLDADILTGLRWNLDMVLICIYLPDLPQPLKVYR